MSVEDVGTLASNEMNEEQVQASVEVGETSIANVVKIEVDLHKTIEMIVEQENVTFFLVLEQDNEDEHVIKHVNIDAGDILNLIYNLLPYTSSLFERMGGLFLQICDCNTFINHGS